jgi:AcrR family transcriptional regulator
MARRNDHSREEIREMALAAAEEIVAQQGFEGLSTRQVARDIGYAAGTLYHVFDNLDDLILQVNGRTLDRLYRRMEQSQAPSSSPRKGLMGLAKAYLGFASEETLAWEMVFKHRLPEFEKAPDWLREKVARIFELVESRLRPLAPGREPTEIAEAARALWGGVHGICILALTGSLDISGADSVERLTHSLIAHYLDGFVAAGHRGAGRASTEGTGRRPE